MFLKRRGDGSFLDVNAMWSYIHSDEYLQHLLEIGTTASHIHFHKGYGLETEADSIQEAKEWGAKLHAAGINVGVYIGSTFFTETFQHPELDEMLMKHDMNGWNAAQYFRKFWCHNSPVTREYFKKVIREAIEVVEADILHFDTGFCFYLDQLCHCEYCLEAFNRFKAESIPEIADIAGFDDSALLSPPPCGNREYFANLDAMKEPGSIAWSLFHAQSGYDSLKGVCDYARSLKKDIKIFYNGCQMAGITRYCHPDMSLEKLALVDLSCTEDCNENPVYVTDDGMPVSRFRAYKVANRAKSGICYYTVTESEDNELMMAEAAAFNYNCLGFIETGMQVNHKLEAPADLEFIQHLIANERFFVDQTPWSSVAVLRHHESMLLNQYPANLTPYVVEQALFEAHLPFSIINSTDINAKTLSEFAVLILPDSRSLGDDEICEIERYVSDGGRLISIGDSGTATNLNQFREEWGLSNIFNMKTSPFKSRSEYAEVAVSTTANLAKSDKSDKCETTLIRAEYGEGLAVHVPTLDFDIPNDAADLNTFGGFTWYYHPYWKPAKDIGVLLSTLDSMLDGKPRVETNLPRHVGVEFFRIASDGWRVHFVNFRNPDVIRDAKITIYSDFFNQQSLDLTFLSEKGDQSVSTTSAGQGEITFNLDKFHLMLTAEITPKTS